jgi:hypothetical protein
LTAIAVVVALLTKFLAGAWVVTLAIPLLIVMFARTEGYYTEVATELELGKSPQHPKKRVSLVIVPVSVVDVLTDEAMSAALSIGDKVVALYVAGDQQDRRKIQASWQEWGPGVALEVLVDPHRSPVRTVLRYIRGIDEPALITVLIPEVVPRKRRHEILHNQRGRLLADVLRAETEVAVTTLPFRLND